MRKLILLFLFIIQLLTVNAFAQNTGFAPVGATWHYKIGRLLTNHGGYVQLKVDRDTIIDGKKCAVIKGIEYYKPNIPVEMDSSFIITQDSLKVEYFTNGKFTTLYDFGAKQGDSWTIEEDFNINTANVVAVDSVKINGLNHKRLIVNYSNYPKHDTIIERIGGLHSFIPILSTKENRLVFRGINCYSDSFLSYKHIEGPCETLLKVGVEDEAKSNDLITIYPNPFNSQFFIKYSDGEVRPQTVTIYDLSGRVVFRESSMNPEIKLPNLKPGVYMFRMETDNALYYTKLIKR